MLNIRSHLPSIRAYRLGRRLLVLWLGLFPGIFSAQTPLLDSLRAVLRSTVAEGTVIDTARSRLLLRISAAQSRSGAYDLAFACTNEAIGILERLAPTLTDPAVLDPQLATANKQLGRLFTYQGDHENALKSLQESHRIAERTGNVKDIGSSLTLMAGCFREMGDPQQALVYGRRSIGVLSAIPDGKDLGLAYMGLAGAFSNVVGSKDSAMFYFKKARHHFERTKDLPQLAAVDLNLAERFQEMGQLDSSLHYLQLGGVHVAHLNPQSQLRYHGMLGRGMIMQHRFREGLAELLIAEQMADGNPADLGFIHHIRALALAGMGEQVEAYLESRRGDDAILADLDIERTNAITEARVEFEHEKEQVLAQRMIGEQRIRTRYAIALACGVFALAVLLFARFRASKRYSTTLEAKNQEILRAQQELMVSEKQREAEQVRTRIASDIHDELGGDLTKISLLGKEVQRRSMEDPTSVSEAADRLGRLSREVVGALRDIVWSVDPEQDTWQGLVSHASAYAQRALDGTGIQADLHFTHHGPDAPIDPATKRDIFLLLKEALNNSVKHANASVIHVNFTTHGEGFQLIVKDNGDGFDPVPGMRDGNGLRNMRKRSERLGAQWDLAPVPGKGTTLTVRSSLVPA
ncbi:MAG TPA: tetratricopeptide repeat protein [Flavobacteriales bacterium]|nr:tetratricopeptide repeat protein [Flavobacteriales bacterium]